MELLELEASQRLHEAPVLFVVLDGSCQVGLRCRGVDSTRDHSQGGTYGGGILGIFNIDVFDAFDIRFQFVY